MRQTAGRRIGSLIDTATVSALAVAVAALRATAGTATGQTITPGQIIFVNSCGTSLTLLANGKPLARLDPGGQRSVAISTFPAGSANVVISYPNLDSARCPNCDSWTDLGGVPGTVQRAAWMWMDNDAKYAAYCNPNL